MKVLLTTDWYTPAVNGVVTSVLALRRQLQRQACRQIAQRAQPNQTGPAGITRLCRLFHAHRPFPSSLGLL